MKKIISLVAILTIAISVSARETNTFSVAFNDSLTAVTLIGEGHGGVFDTTLINEIPYVVNCVHPYDGFAIKTTAPTGGPYFHNSNKTKGDNYVELYVPGGVKGRLAITYATGSSAQSYNFFANIANAEDSVPATLYDTVNVVSTKIQTFSTSKSKTIVLDTLDIDLYEDFKDKVIRIFHVSTTGGRFHNVTWIESEVNPDKPTAIVETKKEAVARKMMVNGQMVIVRDGVKYSAIGAKL